MKLKLIVSFLMVGKLFLGSESNKLLIQVVFRDSSLTSTSLPVISNKPVDHITLEKALERYAKLEEELDISKDTKKVVLWVSQEDKNLEAISLKSVRGPQHDKILFIEQE